MIKKWLLPKQKLAVGKLEYKTCIEASLKIPCLFDDAVMELMWGLKKYDEEFSTRRKVGAD
jgi:nucleolar protein 58